MTARRLPDSLRSRLEVATALAWEALVDTHISQALAFVRLLDGRVPLEEALPRYLLEVDIGDAMASAVRTRVLSTVEAPAEEKAADGSLVLRPDRAPPVPAGDDEQGWRRFRPDVVMRGIRQRQKRDDQIETWIMLALARAEEAIIATHVDNAITFAALLGGYIMLDRGVQEYLAAVNLSGGRAQAVYQRTMARLADVHLPSHTASRE